MATSSNNIQEALKRIKDLRDSLRAHYIASTGLNNPENIGENSTLETIVDAYNKISVGIQSTANTTTDNPTYKLDNTTTLTLTAGYYPNEITVTGLNSDADQAEAVDAALSVLKQEIKSYGTSAADVLVGQPYTEIVEDENGKLTVQKGEGTLNEVVLQGSSEADTEGNKTVVVSANGVNLNTNILYKEDTELVVNVLNSAQGTVTEVSSLTPGYYANDIRVNILDNGTDIGEINVESSVTATSAGEINPSEGFDYIKQVIIPEGSSSVTASVDGNIITLTPSNTSGWVDSTTIKDNQGNPITEIVIPAQESGGDAEVSIDSETNEVLVTIPGGYYDGSTTVVLSKTDNGTTAPVSIISAISNEPQKVDSDYTIVIPEGYNAEEQTLSLGNSTINVSGVSTTEITSQTVVITSSEGYTEGQTLEYKVKDAEVNIEYSAENNAIVINTGENNVNAGWFTRAEIGLSNEVIDVIVQDRGTDLSIKYSDFSTSSENLEKTGTYKKVTLDVTDLIEEIDSI